MRRLALVFLLGCTQSATVDGGVDGAADVEFDGPLACAADAGIDADGAIELIKPTHAPYQDACTPQQITDYAKCQGAKQTDLCTQFTAGQSGEACGKCVETPIDATEWGVLVFQGLTTAFFNVEGCVNDALGQSASDPDSCGQELHNLYRCEEIICSACTGNDFALCELQTVTPTGACATYDQTVFSPSGLCSALTGDAAPPEVTNCFPDTSKANDPQAQEVDWLTRIVGYMCGAPP